MKRPLKSFIADLGRPLWLTDTFVHFRDEPTETWFREKFSVTLVQIASYITRLKPLAYIYPYVAETLPSLLLQAEQYSELIELALSDDLLPEGNPIDERNVRVYRLQFAFRAALKLKHYADAIKLALRAGEEVAGDKRQIELLKANVDLIAPLQAEERVQELAFAACCAAVGMGRKMFIQQLCSLQWKVLWEKQEGICERPIIGLGYISKNSKGIRIVITRAV